MCLRIADTYDGEVRRALRTAVTLIEPALIITFGGLVGFVALAMLQAIYGIDLKTF
jgi:type II secretory pathway component PulF